jgi:predicted DNA-binding transcriptional regulator AlpA
MKGAAMARLSTERLLVSNTDEDRLLRKAQVAEMLGVDPVTLWTWVKAGQFPKGLILNPRSSIIAWKLSTVRQWIDQRQHGFGPTPLAANAARRKRVKRVVLKPAAERRAS